MKIVYAISAVLVLTVAVLVFSGRGTGYAQCCGSDDCGWSFNPTVTDAVAITGRFDTGTDTIPEELTINWCFTFDPIGGGVEINSASSQNIASVQYDPSSFATAGCVGGQVVYASGALGNAGADGTLVTKATIGPFPACVRNKSLTVRHH
jgi:hypothetical protein